MTIDECDWGDEEINGKLIGNGIGGEIEDDDRLMIIGFNYGLESILTEMYIISFEGWGGEGEVTDMEEGKIEVDGVDINSAVFIPY